MDFNKNDLNFNTTHNELNEKETHKFFPCENECSR